MKITNNFINAFFTRLIIISLFMSSCKYKSNNLYIISKEDSLRSLTYKTKEGVILAPPQIPIGTYNLIIDDKNNCFLYLLPEPTEFVPGIDNTDTLSSSSTELVMIPNGCEQKILEHNVIKIKSKLRTKAITVASFSDTINHPMISYLKDLEKDKLNHIYLVIRKANESEKRMVRNKW